MLIQRDQHAELPRGDFALARQVLVEPVVAGFEQPKQKSDAALELPVARDIRGRTRFVPLSADMPSLTQSVANCDHSR